MSNLAAIKADIAHARQWARTHFNAYVDEETTPSHIFAKPTAKVEFPEPDTMLVTPVVYGEPMIPMMTAEYRLCWKGEHSLVWKGNLIIRKEMFGEGNIIELRVV
jgi:hypothetical protein